MKLGAWVNSKRGCFTPDLFETLDFSGVFGGFQEFWAMWGGFEVGIGSGGRFLLWMCECSASGTPWEPSYEPRQSWDRNRAIWNHAIGDSNRADRTV